MNVINKTSMIKTQIYGNRLFINFFELIFAIFEFTKIKIPYGGVNIPIAIVVIKARP